MNARSEAADLNTLGQAVRAVGGRMEVRPNSGLMELQVNAPPGEVWLTDDSHVLTAAYYLGDRLNKRTVAADLIERVRCGVRKCTEENCEICLANTVRVG